MSAGPHHARLGDVPSPAHSMEGQAVQLHTFALSLGAAAGAGARSQAAELKVRYPVPYVLCQRHTPTEGRIRIRGTLTDVAQPGPVEARFAGGPWRTVDERPADGVFTGSIAGTTGQGGLDVRLARTPACGTSVPMVSVGDLFLVTGQSNADGRGTEHLKLSESNPYVGVKYAAGGWSVGDDPSSWDGKHGSPWPVVLNSLIRRESVPMGFIQAAVGSTVVKQWRREGSMFRRMLDIVKKATDGTMGVKAVLYYQGENDITHWNKLSVLGDYAAYKQNLAAAVAAFHGEFSVPMLVGQITNLGSERGRNDGVRRAQQEAWAGIPHCLRGAVTYDIRPTDGVHYRDEANMRAFAGRWTAAILSGLYGSAEHACPELLGLKRIEPQTIELAYDTTLKVGRWDGTPGDKALGFTVRDGDNVLTDAAVASTQVSGSVVTLTLTKPFSAGATLSLGSGVDGQGRATLRSAANGLPMPMLFDRRVDGAGD